MPKVPLVIALGASLWTSGHRIAADQHAAPDLLADRTFKLAMPLLAWIADSPA